MRAISIRSVRWATPSGAKRRLELEAKAIGSLDHPGIANLHDVVEHDGALVVRVAARAVEGQATEAALVALAVAFGVRRRSVTLLTGATSRTKIVDVAGGEQPVLDRLLAGGDSG